jgi:hypothetical protein
MQRLTVLLCSGAGFAGLLLGFYGWIASGMGLLEAVALAAGVAALGAVVVGGAAAAIVWVVRGFQDEY